jgi:hypothetical protein
VPIHIEKCSANAQSSIYIQTYSHLCQLHFLFPDIHCSLTSNAANEFISESRYLAMQSSGKNPLEIHRLWETDVLSLLKETKEAMLEGDKGLMRGNHGHLLEHLSFPLGTFNKSMWAHSKH